MDARICPQCKSDEETIQYDSSLSYELRQCETCNIFYEVRYDLKIRDIKILDRRWKVEFMEKGDIINW